MKSEDTPRAAEGWLLLPPEHVPPNWEARGVPLTLVPLLPHETATVLDGKPATKELAQEDEELIRLVAQGLSTVAIASRLNMPLRSVERRLGRLRKQFQVDSTAELAVFLARRGF